MTAPVVLRRWPLRRRLIAVVTPMLVATAIVVMIPAFTPSTQRNMFRRVMNAPASMSDGAIGTDDPIKFGVL